MNLDRQDHTAPLDFPVGEPSMSSVVSECMDESMPVQPVSQKISDVYKPLVGASRLSAQLPVLGKKRQENQIHLGIKDPTTLEPDPSFQDSLAQANQLIYDINSNSFDALGIAVIVHNQNVPDSIAYDDSLSVYDNGKLKPLDGIERGTQLLNDRFANLGILPIQVKNPRKADLIEILDILSSSYISTVTLSKLCFFLYITGHGARLVFFLKDGSMSYNSAYEKVSSRKTALFKYRWFIFDCCRSYRLDDASFFPDEYGVLSREPNIKRKGDCMLFATVDGNEAYGPGDGVSFMTYGVCDLLAKSIPFKDVVIKLSKYLVEKGQILECRTAADIDINLSTERDRKMQPKITLTEPDQTYLKITVDIFQPIAKNSTRSMYERCEVKLRFNETCAWTKLKIVYSFPKELSNEPITTTELICVLPTDERGDNQQTEMQVHACYSGELTVSSNKVNVELPPLRGPDCSIVEINRDIDDPSINVQWTYEPQLSPYLEVSQYEVTLKTIGSNDDVPKHFTIDKSQNFAHIAVQNLFDCDKVYVKVSAKRSDDCVIEGKEDTKDIAKAKPVLNGRTCTTEVQYKFHSSIKVEWQMDLVDPNVNQYVVIVQNEEGVIRTQTYEANLMVNSVNFPVSLSLLSKGNNLRVFVEAKRLRGETTRSAEHVVRIKREWYTNCSSFFRRLLCCQVSIVALFISALVIVNYVSLDIDNHKMKDYVTSNTIEIDKINSKTIVNFFLHIEGWVVTQTDNHEQDVAVFCSGYNNSQIDNSRQIKYLLPNTSYHEVNQNLVPGNYSLPIGVVQKAIAFYLGKGSVISFYICPRSTDINVKFILLNDYEQLNLFVSKSNDFNRNSLIANISVDTGLHCKNHSVYTVTQSSYIFTAIETFMPLNFTLLDGYISQVFYNATLLNITDPHNRLSREMIGNKINAEVGSTLICTAPNTTKFVVLESYLNQHYSIQWGLAPIVLILIIFACLMAVIVCFSIKRCYSEYQSRERGRNVYHQLN